MNNREIKFRIWDKIGKVYRGNLYKYLINADTGELEVWSFSDLYDEWYNTHEGDEHLVVQQYTGLKDKNGKEIYEGDIISGEFYDTEYHHSETIKAQVVFNNGAFNIAIREWHKPSLEIIGNIFENPELIKNNDNNNQ